MMNPQLSTFWSLPAEQVLTLVQSTPAGLSSQDAKQHLSEYGANSLKQQQKSNSLTLLLNQFKSPIILILIFAAVLSIFLQDAADAIIILTIVLLSGLLGFWQERGATDAVEKLLALVQVKATVLRDGQSQEIPNESVVPGDIVLLWAGGNIPGDCLVLESKDLSVNEATLTGETYPADKMSGVLPAETDLGQRSNILYMGTSVISGTAKAVVVHTGKQTEFGKVSERLKLRPPETEFETGLRKFGYFLREVTLILVVLIFVANVYLKRPVLESFLFSLALAVGLTPQLLPAIVSVNLARGAKQMAKKQVIVKRLPAIEPKMITGDSRAVAVSIIQQVGLPEPKVLTGSELLLLNDEALMHRVQETNVFAEVEPNQKERIIIALKKAGNVVGYLGDGINDASALHAADVGIYS